MKHDKRNASDAVPELRTLEAVSDDLLWPDVGFDAPDANRDRRRQALAYVLCRIPETDYRWLADAIDTFSWFIPQAWKRASCELFPLTFTESPLTQGARRVKGARVVYLSPTLERTPPDVLVAIVAHELAHLVLKHSLWPGRRYDAQEEEADHRICQWGFEREHRRHQANKRRLGFR